MKLLIINGRIAGTVSEEYTGPSDYMVVPEDFELVDDHYSPNDGEVTPGVPSSVTMRQARLALAGAGLIPAVEAALAALPEPQKTAAAIEWNYSNEVWRDKPFVQTFGALLGLTSAQLDDLFRAAAVL